MAWLPPWLVFGAGFVVVTWPRPLLPGPPRVAWIAAAAQTAAALLLARSGKGIDAVLLTVVAGTLPALCQPWAGAGWIGAQTLALWFALARDTPQTLGQLAFELFAFGASLALRREALAREELATAHAELLAAQALVAEKTRALERVRIARDLHDGLGHHLTALLIRLEIAAQSPESDPQLAQALKHSRAVIAEAREAVAQVRREGVPDLAPALIALANAVPAPRVHLSLPDDLRVPDPAASDALLRCVQEIVTNTARHAGAQNLWIDCTRSETRLDLRARDDGRGASDVRIGSGLRGMRERLEEAGGGLELETRQRGFALRAWLPLASPEAPR